jgi:hypothetical protein
MRIGVSSNNVCTFIFIKTNKCIKIITIVMLSQMLLHVSARWTTVHCFQQHLTISTYIHSAKLLIGATSPDVPLLICNVHRQVAYEDRVSSLMVALMRRNM